MRFRTVSAELLLEFCVVQSQHFNVKNVFGSLWNASAQASLKERGDHGASQVGGWAVWVTNCNVDVNSCQLERLTAERVRR